MPTSWLTTTDSLLQIRHLYRRQRSFEAFVSHLQTGAVDGLFQRFAGEHAESVGHAGLLRGLPDAARDFIDDDIVMRRIAAKQATEADDRVVFLRFSQRASGRRNLKRTRHADDLNVFVFRAAAQQSIESATKQSFRNELVKTRDDDAETSSRGAEATFKRLNFNRLCGARGRMLFVVFRRDFLPPR